jgi:tetratricopeptide (TPR) repeat protein
MSYTPPQRPALAPTATASEFLATLGIIFAAIAALVLVDSGLVKVDSAATRLHATSEYQVGESLIANGKLREAIDHLRTASTLDRGTSRFTVALAQAILADGRPADAEPLLTPLLERDATDGATNLAMARTLAKEGRIEEAKSYYHRAIYGLWPGDAEKNRATARFELIDLLAQNNQKQELLSELLPIQDEAPNDTVMRKKIAHLFVVAGSPARAAAIFRDVLRHNSRDADAYVGLGDAALALGDYPSAQADFASALRLSPDDSAIMLRAKLADTVTAIDPTQRGLGLDEQVRRSKNLLQMTITSARKCLGTDAPQVAAALDSVTHGLVASSGAVSRSQAIEENLALAGQLWQMRGTKCAAAPRNEEALSLVQDRIAR